MSEQLRYLVQVVVTAPNLFAANRQCMGVDIDCDGDGSLWMQRHKIHDCDSKLVHAGYKILPRFELPRARGVFDDGSVVNRRDRRQMFMHALQPFQRFECPGVCLSITTPTSFQSPRQQARSCFQTMKIVSRTYQVPSRQEQRWAQAGLQKRQCRSSWPLSIP